jgi:hypothetical protein
MSTDTTQELAVVDRTTGEIIDIAKADTARLAMFCTNLGELRKELAEAEGIVSDELVDRMDHEALYTLHVEDGEQQWEIKGSSPTAGTTVYLEDVLETELQGLVEENTITPEAAGRALHRHISLQLGVPWNADPREIAQKVKEALSIEVAGVAVTVERAEARAVPITSGINALRKQPGTISALDRAKREQPPGRRKATVKLKAQQVRDRPPGEKGSNA